MGSSLSQFLAPKSIVIVGASADPTKRGYKALSGLLRDGYQGKIFPINPKADQILGVPCYPNLESLPQAADLALLCTPAHSVPTLIRQCGKAGVKGAVVLASGFAEMGGEGVALEQALLEASQQSGVRVVGPNTSGMFNLHERVNLLALDGVQPGGIGIISQSGNMLLALALEAQYHGDIGFSTYVGPGNQTDIGFADYLRYLGDDEHTQVATLYVEGFRNGRDFITTARDVAQQKPVVVYKSGSTEAGQKAASSHTGALAGSYAMTADLLRQAGVSVVGQSDEILPVAEGVSLLKQAAGKRVAILSDGGGQATIASDRLSEAGLELAVLQPQTRDALAAILFSQASLVNPVDVAGSTDANPALFTECLSILESDPGVDMVFLVGMFGGYALRFAAELADAEQQTAEAIVQLRAKGANKPMVVYSLYSPLKPQPLLTLHRAGIPVSGSIEHSVQILRVLAERGDFIRRCKLEDAPLNSTRSSVAEQLIQQAIGAGRDLLEPEAREVLQAYGIKLPEAWLVDDPSKLASVIEQANGQALAMKVVSADILHKSDAGGVKLNLRTEADLQLAHQSIMESCQRYKADADIKGVLLSPMAKSGTEVIIGVTRDPIFGPVLMFGLGGIFVEVLEDVAFRSIPLQRADALGMIDQIRARKLLQGVRGQPAIDREALADLLLRVADLVNHHPEINELDLNPVILYQQGYAVVDARMIIR